MELLNPEQSYTFSKIFELKIEPKDLAAEFGYTLSRQRLNLPQYQQKLDRLVELQARIEEILPYVSLVNETARRELLISPVILDLIHYTKSEVKIEYNIKVNNQLQGNFDYLLLNQGSLLVIEAKKEDLDYGFSQLVAELVALEKWKNQEPQSNLVGAVTTGKIWEFGVLNRHQKHIIQGLDSYRVPDDLGDLMRILVNILLT